jgi:hypothetical protein
MWLSTNTAPTNLGIVKIMQTRTVCQATGQTSSGQAILMGLGLRAGSITSVDCPNTMKLGDAFTGVLVTVQNRIKLTKEWFSIGLHMSLSFQRIRENIEQI